MNDKSCPDYYSRKAARMSELFDLREWLIAGAILVGAVCLLLLALAVMDRVLG